MTVSFATFCHRGDAHRLHAPDQLRHQVQANGYNFEQVVVIHQRCDPADYAPFDCPFPVSIHRIDDLDTILTQAGIDIHKPQYTSDTDHAHIWKYHVVNHMAALSLINTDYVVFADADCWMIRQPDSWVIQGMSILAANPDVFIVSPNDGEPARRTQVISQQMFMTRVEDFRRADFNQPGWDGNVRNHPEMPEYHGMLEGRIHHYCRATGRYRYVLPPEYRYWHHGRTNPQTGLFETDLSKY